MLKLLFAATLVLLALSIKQCKSIVFNDTTWPCPELPSNIKPTGYQIVLHLLPLHIKNRPIYSGEVNISFEFQKEVSTKSKSLNILNHERGIKEVGCNFGVDRHMIVLHADKSLDIKKIKVYSVHSRLFSRGMKYKEYKISALFRDQSKQMIAIKLSRGIKKSGVVSIFFSGKLRNDNRGIYMTGSSGAESIVCHLQPNEVRLLFPCFDELRFKVPFQLTLHGGFEPTAIGNVGVRSDSFDGTVIFATTSRLPLHMFAFALTSRSVSSEEYDWVSQAGRKTRRVTRDNKVRVITNSGLSYGRSHFVALYALNWFERYIDFYYPLSELDLFFIPDLNKGSTTGSLGLVFLNEMLFLDHGQEEPNREITASLNIAYAVVRQWFGNLLSVGRLSEMWITESVAAHFAIEISRDLYPESDYLVRLATMTNSLQADHSGEMYPLPSSESYFRTSESAYKMFDRLKFIKGASLAQTLSNAIGADKYQAALRSLMHKHAEQTIYFSDYAEALSGIVDGQTHSKVINMLKTFVKFRGMPLLDVTEDRDGRLFLGWHTNGLPRGEMQDLVMFVNSSSVDVMGSVTSASQYLASLESCEIELPTLKNSSSLNFVKIDLDPSIRTCYRTHYTDSLLERLMLAVKKKLIGPMDRLHLLDDANTLVTAGLMKVDVFSRLLDSYINENHGAVLLGMLIANQTLSQLTKVGSEAATRAIWSIYEDYGFGSAEGTSPIMQHARQVALTWFINQGNQQVIDAAVNCYVKRNCVKAFLREPVYTALVLTNSSHLHDLVKSLPSIGSFGDRIRLVSTLGLSKNNTILRKVAEFRELELI